MSEFRPRRVWEDTRNYGDIGPSRIEFAVDQLYINNKPDELKQLLWEIASRTYWLEGKLRGLATKASGK